MLRSYDLPIAIGKRTFCGLTQKWSPRFSHVTLLVLTILPVLLYWFILFLMVKGLVKLILEIWRTQLKIAREMYQFHNLSRNFFETTENYIEKCTRQFIKTEKNQRRRRLLILEQSYQIGKLFRYKSFVSTVLLVLVKYFWDAIDLTLDVYIFYRLERGDVLDKAIYRNIHVNNAIYAFAILGCLTKLFAWKFYVHSVNKEDVTNDESYNVRIAGNEHSTEVLHTTKYFVTFISFIFEDGPELILEYFYIEKYITDYTALIVVKDAIICCMFIQMALAALIAFAKTCKGGMKYIDLKQLVLNILIVSFTLATLLRVSGALYQYVTKKLRRSCFEIDNGKIMQTPFDIGCMREVDFVILAFTGISMFALFVFAVKFLYDSL